MPAGTGFRMRGYIPHIDVERATQFVTFRLADSLPRVVFDQLAAQLQNLSESERKRESLRRVELLLDKGLGSQLLRNPVAANIVVDSLLFAHRRWFTLHAFVVMPTHVHALATMEGQFAVGESIRRIKSFTAKEMQKALGLEPGRLWQPDFFDKIVKSEGQFGRTVDYIEWNAVKAGLCTDPAQWPYSSANEVVLKRMSDA